MPRYMSAPARAQMAGPPALIGLSVWNRQIAIIKALIMSPLAIAGSILCTIKIPVKAFHLTNTYDGAVGDYMEEKIQG
jgi:hypothetical protein